MHFLPDRSRAGIRGLAVKSPSAAVGRERDWLRLI